MGIYIEKDIAGLTEEEKKRLCTWCWFHDFGDCKYCVLFGALKSEPEVSK